MRYVVLLPGNGDSWENASAQERAATYTQHEQFAKLLAVGGTDPEAPA
jgi:hypothetical protein